MANETDKFQMWQTVLSDKWAVLARSGLDQKAIATWDRQLVRTPRLLVPVDVQALYVPESGYDEKFVRIPLKLTSPDGSPPEPDTPPFAKATRRPPGVHLHWAVPDALMSGKMSESAGGVSGMAALANRWVVLRIIAPVGDSRTVVRGWVVESDTSRIFDLEDWKEGISGGTALGHKLAPKDLTGTAGGALSWTAAYDATLNRFALHDPLDDLKSAAPEGAFGNLATYVVAGWWSTQELDPLDPAVSGASLAKRLAELKWSAPPYTPDENHYVAYSARQSEMRAALGLDQQTRVDIVEIDQGKASEASRRLVQSGAREIFMPDGTRFLATEPKQVFATLLHGQIHGVPVAGGVVADRRPAADHAELVVGQQIEDLVAGFAAGGMGVKEDAKRRQAERLLTAIVSDSLSRIGDPNGVVDIEEQEHAAGFVSAPGDMKLEEIILDRGGPETLVAGRHARKRWAREGAGPDSATVAQDLLATAIWTGRKRGALLPMDGRIGDLEREWEKRRRPPPASAPAARVVKRPGPRYHQPDEPVIGLRNIKRVIRQRCTGRSTPDGTLACRWPSQVGLSIGDVVGGAKLLGAFPSGAIPSEILRVARNALITDPYLAPWIAAAAARSSDLHPRIILTRLKGETALRFAPDGTYDGGVPSMSKSGRIRITPQETQTGNQLRRFSLLKGTDASPVAVTAWAQPWLPLWLEWKVRLDLSDKMDGWHLGAVDLETAKPVQTTRQRIISGRSQINTGAATALMNAVENWIVLEEARDRTGKGEADAETEQQIAEIDRHLGCVDIASATMNGILNTLLGLPHAADGLLQVRGGDGLRKIKPVDIPQLLYSGRLKLMQARVIDAFGRVMDLDADKAVYPTREKPPAARHQQKMLLRPRLTRPSRWVFRFADPADTTAKPAVATLNQAHPELMVNPVSGYLLPDLIDEALEVFDTAGNPLGQLMEDPISGGVTWEIAPGRAGPADAGPLFGLDPAQMPVGRMAAAMVERDAQTRGGKPLGPGSENALSSFLRAVDTTLWSIDTFATLGTPHIAGLVGRPMALVRATLQLQIKDDLDDLDLSGADARAQREAQYRDLKDRGFPVRLGELTRDDDGVYGFFVNDDYSRFHLVDKLVKDQAFVAGRLRGYFGQLGKTPRIPGRMPIRHPYIVAEDELTLYPDQVLRLTLLMHPAGKVHLTSGILPRKSLQLLHDWIEPGLARMAPSARIGPVLVDPGKVRLPKVAAFGKDQSWTRRDTPFTWRDDPILAATQTALLPDAPAQVEEGYIRITPTTQDKGDT